MRYETENWRRIQARWYQKVEGKRPVRFITFHSMEFYERGDTAEVIAKDFAVRPATNKASCHICVDNNTIIQSVLDNDVAFGAKGGNREGIHIELAGYAKQTREQWLDDYGRAMFALACDAAAQYCLKYNIPPKHLSDEELRAGKRGIVGHDQITRVYKVGDHTDPGPHFPWDYVIALIEERVEARR